MDWSNFPNFKEEEFRCKHTGICQMDRHFMARLQAIRNEFAKPMVITSGYRHPSHPVEAKKLAGLPGAHTTGHAADISVRGEDAYRLIVLAWKYGFTGIGVNQKGDGRYIHLDDISDGSLPRPTIWSY
jgi:uncharacterized protein YcbK (DUF882 family)